MKENTANQAHGKENSITGQPAGNNATAKNEKNTGSGESPQKRKVTSRQIVAVAGVALLVLLYLIPLVTAIVDSSASAQWFRICLAATFALPLLLWLYSWMYGRLTGKSAIGDPSEQSKDDSREDDFT